MRNKNGSNRDGLVNSRYHAPYNRLFHRCVIEDEFSLMLLAEASFDQLASFEPVDCGLFMVLINLEEEPFLFAEIKDDGWVDEPDKRWRADIQMRRRFDEMLDKCPLPRLYGLSLLGTSLRVYSCDKATRLMNPRVPKEDRTFLEGQWDVDLLSQEGFQKFQDIVAYIKAESEKV